MVNNELETWLSEGDLLDLNDRQLIEGYVKLGTALEYLTEEDN